MFKKTWSYSLLALAVVIAAGCSSGVKLDDQASVGDAVSTDSGASTSGVTGIDLMTASTVKGEGPANVAHTIYFDFDSYTLNPQAQSVLQTHAKFLRANANRTVTLEGHTDERGGREYNLALGQKRAEAARQSLELLGIPASQVEAVSYGKEKPAVQGYGEDAYAQNRRVEIRYNN